MGASSLLVLLDLCVTFGFGLPVGCCIVLDVFGCGFALGVALQLVGFGCACCWLWCANLLVL